MDERSPRTVPQSPRGMALLHDPLLNKGTAFTEEERDAPGLRGLFITANDRGRVADVPADVRSEMYDPRYSSYV